MIAEPIFWYMILTVLLALTNNALVEIFHHSKLFKRIRDFLAGLYLKNRKNKLGFWLKSHRCAFCLSYQFALLISIPFFNEWMYLPCALAIGRLSNLINDHSYPYLRTPR